MSFNLYLQQFYNRMAEKAELDNEIRKCDMCEGLNVPGETLAAPGYGNVCSPVMLIGQSLCAKCMDTQVPFTRGSGDILDAIFHSVGIHKYDLLVTNVVHCHPPKNRPSKDVEISNCSAYLEREILLVKPELIICLGKDASGSLEKLGVKFSLKQFETTEATLFELIKVKAAWAYHPAYLLRKPDREMAKEYKRGFRRLLKCFLTKKKHSYN